MGFKEHDTLTVANGGLHEPKGLAPTPLIVGGGIIDAYLIEDVSGNNLFQINTTGKSINLSNSTDPYVFLYELQDNSSTSFILQQGSDNYLSISTDDSTPAIDLGSTAIDPDFNLLGGGDTTFGANLNTTAAVSPCAPK